MLQKSHSFIPITGFDCLDLSIMSKLLTTVYMRRTNTKRRETSKLEGVNLLSTGSQCGQTPLDMETVCHEVSSMPA